MITIKQKLQDNYREIENLHEEVQSRKQLRF